MRYNGKHPAQNGVYKLLVFNGIPKEKRGKLVRKFTNIDITKMDGALRAAEHIQNNWKKFIAFLKVETGKDIKAKIPRKRKRSDCFDYI